MKENRKLKDFRINHLTDCDERIIATPLGDTIKERLLENFPDIRMDELSEKLNFSKVYDLEGFLNGKIGYTELTEKTKNKILQYCCLSDTFINNLEEKYRQKVAKIEASNLGIKKVDWYIKLDRQIRLFTVKNKLPSLNIKASEKDRRTGKTYILNQLANKYGLKILTNNYFAKTLNKEYKTNNFIGCYDCISQRGHNAILETGFLIDETLTYRNMQRAQSFKLNIIGGFIREPVTQSDIKCKTLKELGRVDTSNLTIGQLMDTYISTTCSNWITTFKEIMDKSKFKDANRFFNFITGEISFSELSTQEQEGILHWSMSNLVESLKNK